MITRREALTGVVGTWLVGGLASAGFLSGRFGGGGPVPIAIPSTEKVDLTDHILARLAHGARPGDREALTNLGVEAWIDEQLAPEDLADAACAWRLRRLDVPDLPTGECYEFKPEVVADEVAIDRLLRAVFSRRQLQERLVDCWCDHFSLSLGKDECAWLGGTWIGEVIRPHALGRFRDLVAATLRHPAMLWFLDGRLNRADPGPVNENHGRELLELHTLGVEAGYTQDDVRETARCLSGWTVRGSTASRKGSLAFQAHRHDDGPKRLLGVDLPAGLGAKDVEQVIEVVCSHPASPPFIARRLCRHFLADVPPEPAVQAVAAALADGTIADGVRVLVNHPAFLAPANRRARLKRPFHLVASALRATDAGWNGDRRMVDALASLGHQPLHWPTPDGYPTQADHWTAGLLARWRFVGDLLSGRLGATIDTDALLARCGGVEALAAHCLGRRPDARERAALIDADPVTCLGLLLASPAFQKC